MITLIQFSPKFNLPNPSPFCLKLETFLRMAEIPYQVKYGNDPSKSPKSKLPIILDENGKTLTDSDLIITHLIKNKKLTIDDHIDKNKRAVMIAVQRMVEEHLYWVMLYFRWVDEKFWPITEKAFFGKLPVYLKFWVPKLVRKKLKNQIYQQGTGRHSREEIIELGKPDIDGIAEILGDNPYIAGDQASSFDASLYAFLACLIDVPYPTELKAYAEQYPQLAQYTQRIREAFWSDWHK